jgi:hypothetical protein
MRWADFGREVAMGVVGEMSDVKAAIGPNCGSTPTRIGLVI